MRRRRPSRAVAAPRCYPGWRVVAGAFLLVLAGFGTIYSYAAFAEEIAREFGASPVSVAFIYALSGSACFFVSAVSGPLADRIGTRVPALAGMAMVALGLAVAAAATSLAEIYVGYGLLIGLGCGFAYVPAMAAVQRWFTRHRGLASGIAASGIGVGTALVPPGAEALLALGDWRLAFLVLAAAVLVTGGIGALLVEPGGAPVEERPAAPQGLPPVLRSRAFACAYAGTLLVSMPAMLPQAMLAGTAREIGLGREEALALLGLIGLGTIAGRFLIAALADAIGRRAGFLACCAGLAGSMAIWALAGSAGALQGFALIFGALQGGFVALLPAHGVDRFGVRPAGAVLGMLYTSRGVALLLAPPLVALGTGHLGGHMVPVLAMGAAGLVGTALLGWVPARPPRPAEAAGAAGGTTEPVRVALRRAVAVAP